MPPLIPQAPTGCRRSSVHVWSRAACLSSDLQSAGAPRQPRLRSAFVFVVAAPPDARLVAPLGRPVEPLVHAPEAIQSARIGRIGVVDDAVLECERAHARPLAPVSRRGGSACGRELGYGWRNRCRVKRVAAAPVVVFDVSLALLLFGHRDA